MLFKRKGKIRKNEDERLLRLLDVVKSQLTNKRELINKSLDPSPFVIYEMNILETQYLFLLREARYRQTTKSGKD